MGIEEMDRKDETGCQKGLIGMDDRGNIEDPSGQEDGEDLREPEHEARKPDSEHPPEDGEKIELLPVGPSVELGLGPFVKEPLGHPDDVLDIFPAGTERIRAKESLEGVGISRDLFEEEKVDDKDYKPAFDLLDSGKIGKIHIEAINDLIGKLEGTFCQIIFS